MCASVHACVCVCVRACGHKELMVCSVFTSWKSFRSACDYVDITQVLCVLRRGSSVSFITTSSCWECSILIVSCL